MEMQDELNKMFYQINELNGIAKDKEDIPIFKKWFNEKINKLINNR